MHSDDLSTAASVNTPHHPGVPTGATILLVDDQEDVRTMCRRGLELDGFLVLEAADGVDALVLMEGNGRIDLVITDMRMPRLGGSELAELLSVFRPDVPV